MTFTRVLAHTQTRDPYPVYKYYNVIEGNEWESHLNQSVQTLKYEFERQLRNEQHRKQRVL